MSRIFFPRRDGDKPIRNWWAVLAHALLRRSGFAERRLNCWGKVQVRNVPLYLFDLAEFVTNVEGLAMDLKVPDARYL